MSRSEIFKAAHRIVKKIKSNPFRAKSHVKYSVLLSEALRKAYATAKEMAKMEEFSFEAMV